jgi:hypothetical protein
MNEIIDIFKASDGYDITVISITGERIVFHFGEKPEDIQSAVDLLILSRPQPIQTQTIEEPIQQVDTSLILNDAYYSMLNLIETFWSKL